MEVAATENGVDGPSDEGLQEALTRVPHTPRKQELGDGPQQVHWHDHVGNYTNHEGTFLVDFTHEDRIKQVCCKPEELVLGPESRVSQPQERVMVPFVVEKEAIHLEECYEDKAQHFVHQKG